MDADSRPAALPVPGGRAGQVASLDILAAIAEEEIWLASQKSAPGRAYKHNLAHFMRTLGITGPEQLRQVDHRAVIAWEWILTLASAAQF